MPATFQSLTHGLKRFPLKLFHSEYAEEYITQLQNQGKHSELAEFGITRPTTTNNTNDINKKRKR